VACIETNKIKSSVRILNVIFSVSCNSASVITLSSYEVNTGTVKHVAYEALLHYEIKTNIIHKNAEGIKYLG
jgi:hypothetical protein